MTFRLSLFALGLMGWLSAPTFAAPDVEVMARGPVHEAYAEPSEREPKATPIIPKAPPKAIEELPPDQKPEGDNVQWMPGYWAWDEDKKDFIWVSGFWRNAPPGRTWMPGSWRKAGDGWQWSGGFWAAAKGGKADIEYLPQPPAPLDAGGPTTPAPSDTHLYVPGTWVYRERYVWRPGFWCEYRPGWCWTAAHYRWTPGGYVFIDGYWDYPLDARGVLFAPAYIPPVIYSAPAYVYTPTVVVREECLYGAFFARRGFGCYYFGDYFAPRYASVGFSAWCGGFGVSIGIGGGGWYDPLFGYYRCGFRHDPYWGHGVFDLYAGRYRGDYLRPPINLVQQNTVINNITNVTNVTNVNTNNVTMLTSLNQAARQKKLEKVPELDRQQHQQIARSTREVAARRADAEAQLATRPGAGGKTGAPTTVALDVPQQPTPKGPTGPTAKGPTVAGVPTRPTPPIVTPPPPKPTPLGKLDPKPGVIVPGKADPIGVPAAGPKTSPKPPLTPRPGTLAEPRPDLRPGTNLEPKGPGAGSTPKGNLPVPKAGPELPARPVPTVDVPAPKPIAPLDTRPPALKPPASSPPVSVPKPPVGAPVAPKLQPPTPAALPRPAAPPPPVSRPAPPPPSKPAASSKKDKQK